MIGNDKFNVSIRGAAVSTISAVLFFGSIIVATTGMAARAWLSGSTHSVIACIKTSPGHNQNVYAQPLHTSFESLFNLCYRTSLFALLLMVLYVLEYHPPFPHASRDPEGGFDADYTAFLLIGLFLWSLTTVSRNDGKKIRDSEKESSSNTTTERENCDNKNLDDTDLISEAISTQNKSMMSNNSTTQISPLKANTGYSLIEMTQNRIHYTTTLDSGSDDGVPNLLKSSTSDHDSDSDTDISMQSTSSSRHGMISPLNDLLSRPQTLELKGLCEIIFLVTQYTHAKTIPQYSNIQQILHSSFLFLTGYHQFSYFYTTRDYSISRLLRSFFRINILAIFLCLSQNTSYFIYYVCMLHSAYFLMVYLIMVVGSRVSTVVTNNNLKFVTSPSLDQYLSINYSKYGLRFKLMIAGLIIYIVWDTNLGVFQLLHFPFLTYGPSIEGAPLGPMWEWYFRSSLHHWMTFLGMIFGANHAIMSLFIRKIEKQSLVKEIMAKGTIGLALITALYIWSSGPLQYDRFEFNDIHGYFGFIPILVYMYFRNVAPVLREYSIVAFSKIGRMALEMYLIHHHAFLSSNGRTLLVLLPGYPKLNLVLVCIIYLFVSHKFHTLIGQLRDVLLPQGNSIKCIWSMAILLALLFGFYFAAFILDKFGMVTPGSLMALITICGILLYQTVMDTTWDDFRDRSRPISSIYRDIRDSRSRQPPEIMEESALSKLSPPLIGVLVVLVLGASWETLALLNINNGKVSTGVLGSKPTPLSPSCAASVNVGKWIPVDSCSDYHRSIAAHRYQVASLAHCHAASGWAWEAHPDECRFHHRDSHVLRNALRHRSIVFIGGSITLRLFHAVCRALGNTDSGFFGAAILEHADVVRQYGSISVRFKYAPLAHDQVTKLNDFQSAKEKIPDLLVIGGGVWDVIHLWAARGDPSSLQASVNSLARSMKSLKETHNVPTVWFIPTTINTKAVTNIDKRNHMGESKIEEMRSLYGDLGVYGAASFVLDGRAFTSQKVNESYDGVHYPPYVYDSGAQILANAMDWVLPADFSSEAFDPPSPGTLGNPFYGFMMLCFCFIGLFFFDSYLGFSYLASFFSDVAMPSDLYEEAFAPLHSKFKLPRINSNRSSRIEDEVLGLIGANKKDQLNSRTR